METLKPLEEAYAPDSRQQHLVVIDHEKQTFRPIRLDDYYKMAESIKLHGQVPEDVRSLFESSRNLILYSWFYYPFQVTAQLQAITCLEFALKIKAGCRVVPNGRPLGLKQLLTKAVNEKWIEDDGFSLVRDWKIRNTGDPVFHNYLGQQVNSYCEVLIEFLPKIRNDLAHGEKILHARGASWVGLCAEIINQLFDNKRQDDE